MECIIFCKKDNNHYIQVSQFSGSSATFQSLVKENQVLFIVNLAPAFHKENSFPNVSKGSVKHLFLFSREQYYHKFLIYIHPRKISNKHSIYSGCIRTILRHTSCMSNVCHTFMYDNPLTYTM